MKKNYQSPVVNITDVEVVVDILAASSLSVKNGIFADKSDALVNTMDDDFIDIWESISK